MQIDPRAQLALLLAALFMGVMFGILWEVLAALRILVGAYRPPPYMQRLYERPLPLLGCTIPFRQGGIRRAFCVAVTAVFDLVYCLFFALCASLVLYEYNDGVPRPAAILAAFLGLGAWRICAGRITERCAAYIAYALAVAARYVWAALRLPVLLLARCAGRLVLRPSRALWRRITMRRLSRVSAALCAAQLALAKTGLDGTQKSKE